MRNLNHLRETPLTGSFHAFCSRSAPVVPSKKRGATRAFFFAFLGLLFASSCRAQTITQQSGGSGATEANGSNPSVTGLTWSVGWLVIASGDINATGQTPTISDSNSNTWTQCNTGSGNYSNRTWYSIIPSGKSGSGISVTMGGVGTHYGILEVSAFSASSGWPTNPVDRANFATTASGNSLAVTESGANQQAVELAYMRAGNNVSGGITGFSAGYTSVQGTAFAGSSYKVTSVVETSSCTVTITGGPTTIDAMLTTFIPGAGGAQAKMEKLEKIDPL